MKFLGCTILFGTVLLFQNCTIETVSTTGSFSPLTLDQNFIVDPKILVTPRLDAIPLNSEVALVFDKDFLLSIPPTQSLNPPDDRVAAEQGLPAPTKLLMFQWLRLEGSQLVQIALTEVPKTTLSNFNGAKAGHYVGRLLLRVTSARSSEVKHYVLAESPPVELKLQ